MREADRLLDNRGAVAIIIQPHVRAGTQVRYWHDTLTALFDDGWRLIAETMWWKPDAAPVGHWRRARQSHEPVAWLSKRRDPYHNPTDGGRHSDRIGLLHGNATMHQRMGNLRSGIARVASVIALPADLPPTVIRAPIGGIARRGSDHPAQQPVLLYEKLIRLGCPPGGLVMDPFIGSGTCAMAARAVGRRYLGYDISSKFVKMARRNTALADHE